MFEGQFYIRLILNVIVGIMFAYALYKMAKHNNQETIPLSHKAMHVVGWIFIGLSVLCLCICIYYLTLVDFPHQLRGPFIGPNTIIRSTSAVFYWGYPTLIQNSTLTIALATFDFLGIGAYFLYFKSSRSKWWKKLLKFFVVLLLYAFMASATNFHYFDFSEFVSPILFFILWIVIVNRKDKSIQSNRNEIEFVKEEQLNTLEDTLSEPSICNGVKESYINPNSSNDNSSHDYDEEEHNNSSTEEEDSTLYKCDMLFCRHCGKEIEANSAYCKYCGGAQIKKQQLYEKPLRPICSIWTKLKSFGNVLDKLFVRKVKTNDRLFILSKRNKVILIAIAMISLITAIIYGCLFRYERWLYSDSYNMIIVGVGISFTFVFIIWFLCHKQERMYNSWRSFVITILFWLSSIISIVSSICIVDIVFSYDLRRAKEEYIRHECLISNNTNILNEELNRRFEEYWNRAENFSSLYGWIKNDKEYFEIIKEESHKNNGVAQGILGEYYFSTGIIQIGDSQNEMGYITDDNLYSKGQGNMERAFYWWKKASENFDPRGMYRLGNCYAHIIEIDGVHKDLNQAYQYWTKASEKGYGMAYKRLGDLFGTWNYLDGVYVEISNNFKKGVDNLGTDENPSFSEPFPLPAEWKHDIAIARSYWEKAVECGGHASEEARKCLEKVYPEEKLRQ